MNVLSLASAAAFVLVANAATAATVTFTDFVTTTDNTDPFPTPVIEVEETGNTLTFSVSSTGEFGKLSGLFFDVSNVLITEDDILNESVSILRFANNTGALGGGVNLNGGFPGGITSPKFDFGFRFAQTDVSGTPLTFQISQSLLTLADLEKVGLRFQSVGLSMSGSAKVIGNVDGDGGDGGEGGENPSPIPLPAGGGLLFTALLGLAFARRRNNAG